MIPSDIIQHLEDRGISFTRHTHPRAITAPEVAESLHVSGRKFAKAVICRVGDHRVVIALVPANAMLDGLRLARVMGKREVRMLTEEEFAPLFPNCEPGAEPPFGSLYGMQVIVDDSLTSRDDTIVFRAGSHDEVIEMRYADFEAIERPIVAPISMPAESAWSFGPADAQV